jgi:hypothetical protein
LNIADTQVDLKLTPFMEMGRLEHGEVLSAFPLLDEPSAHQCVANPYLDYTA